MARADATLRRRRRFDVDDVLPLLIPALALLTTTTRRRDPFVQYDAWHTCVLEGCANLVQPNEAHSFPYLATLVSVLFLGGIMLAWQAIAQEGQSTLMGIDPGVPRCCGAFTPSMRLVSVRQGRGWFLFRF